jgi:hypothetical protein
LYGLTFVSFQNFSLTLYYQFNNPEEVSAVRRSAPSFFSPTTTNNSHGTQNERCEATFLRQNEKKEVRAL